FLAKAQRFHFRPLGVCQYEAIHADLESQSHAFKNHNSQQTPKRRRLSKLFGKKLHQKLFHFPDDGEILR
ncbi:hypothetical protein, partial [Novacetimonas maltaceti]|uniref:hypothetical protein n=1 Tax=Novacetimonas maltaceti TaxID=1203393 RepID=UPI001CA591B7